MLPLTPPCSPPPPANAIPDNHTNTDVWNGTAFEDILIDFARWTFLYTVEFFEIDWPWLSAIFGILFRRTACDKCKIEAIAEILLQNKGGCSVKDSEYGSHQFLQKQAHDKAIELLDINEELWGKLVNRPGNHPGATEILFKCILDYSFFEKNFPERFHILRDAVRDKFPELVSR